MEAILNTILKNLGATDFIKHGDSIYVPSKTFEYINSQIPDITCLCKNELNQSQCIFIQGLDLDLDTFKKQTYLQLRAFVSENGEYLSFCVNEGRLCDWEKIVKQFPYTIWMVDNFEASSNGIFFVDNTIYMNSNSFIISKSDNLDDLMELCPIHYGKVKEMELVSIIDSIDNEVSEIEEQLKNMKDGIQKDYLMNRISSLENLKDNPISEIQGIKEFWKREIEDYDNLKLCDIWAPLYDFSKEHDVDEIYFDFAENYYRCLEILNYKRQNSLV
ncbi:MAG: hypothetical protein K2O00_06670, partial [Muribaculaceae bacterium]|nr:hypothetical protein [Muribaculaceae bacterium]